MAREKRTPREYFHVVSLSANLNGNANTIFKDRREDHGTISIIRLERGIGRQVGGGLPRT